MADNAANKKRISELQERESKGQLSDEEASELQRLQSETSVDGTTPGDSNK